MSMIVQAEVSDVLWQQAQTFVAQGWIDDVQALITESLRRYLESHQENIAEQMIQEDVTWGLYGED